MKIVIIEDEKPAAEKLANAIRKSEPSAEIVAVLPSVSESIQWFSRQPPPDLIFMDIELGDGISFAIFDKTGLQCPVIFCTAYDEYWQEAFEHNSIDYLLKPVKQEKLEAALQKFEKIRHYFTDHFRQLQQWRQATASGQTYRRRFLVKRGSDYVSVRSEEIAYFYAAHKVVCLVTHQNQKFILDQSLSDIERQLDPAQFYRVNRKYLVQLNAIKRIKSYPKSKLQLELEPAIREEIVISQENTAAFKEWMGS